MADKKFTNKNGYAILHEDGTITGEFNNEITTGTWAWEDGYYCRTVKVGSKDLGHDCQVVEVSGDMLTFKSKKGKGRKGSFRIEPES